MRTRLGPAVVLALPGLALAVAGLFHPHGLSYATSERWLVLHLVGLVVFPLVGLALAALVRGRTDPLAWLVRVAAYVYAVFYSALDVLGGIGASYLTREAGAGVPRPAVVPDLYAIGDQLGAIGSYALLAGGAAVALDQLRHHGLAGLPVLALLPGAWLVHTDHIFAPGGVVGMALVGLATGTAAWNAREIRWNFPATSGRLSAS